MLAVNDSIFANSGNVNTDHVLFVGSAFAFPEVILRLMQVEFEGLGAMRTDTLDPDGAQPGGPGLRLVIIEDRFTEALLQGYNDIRQRLGGTPVALAYRDPARARQLLSLQQREGQLEGLRFLPINAPVACWVSMLRLLLVGEFVILGDLVAYPAEAEHAAPRALPAHPAIDTGLTQREREVLDRVAQGHRNKAIADALGVSEHTVKLHIHHIIVKIGVDNRTAAANWYLARGHPDGALRQAS